MTDRSCSCEMRTVVMKNEEGKSKDRDKLVEPKIMNCLLICCFVTSFALAVGLTVRPARDFCASDFCLCGSAIELDLFGHGTSSSSSSRRNPWKVGVFSYWGRSVECYELWPSKIRKSFTCMTFFCSSICTLYIVCPSYPTSLPRRARGAHLSDLRVCSSLWIRTYTVDPRIRRWLRSVLDFLSSNDRYNE